jgi:hypothetical protein
VQNAIPFKTLGLDAETKYHHCWPHRALYVSPLRSHLVRILSGQTSMRACGGSCDKPNSSPSRRPRIFQPSARKMPNQVSPGSFKCFSVLNLASHSAHEVLIHTTVSTFVNVFLIFPGQLSYMELPIPWIRLQPILVLSNYDTCINTSWSAAGTCW